MAVAASNKTSSKKDLRYPEIEEHALQFILDSCESSISKYNKFLQARRHFNKEAFISGYFNFMIAIVWKAYQVLSIKWVNRSCFPFTCMAITIIINECLLCFWQASGSLDLDVTSPKQLNRRLFLKQLAVDLCTSELRILFRAQYVSL